jgi:hypothetical protein
VAADVKPPLRVVHCGLECRQSSIIYSTHSCCVSAGGHFFSGHGRRPAERRFCGQTHFGWQASPVFPAPSPAFRGCGEPFYKVLPQTSHGVEHHLETRGLPIASPFRRLDPEKLAAAKAEFAALERDGISRRSSRNWASPLHMVKKPDGLWRCCCDYRRLNNVTVPDTYPLPTMMDFSARVPGCSIFTKIDLIKGYYQIPMHPSDILKTAIFTPFGLF